MHPWLLHPPLVHFPIAFLTAAVAFDLYAWKTKRPDLVRTATNVFVAGTIAMALAAGAGLLAFFTVPAHTPEAHDLMEWHLGVNVAALLLFAGLSIVRWRSSGVPSTEVRLLGALALVLVLFGAKLGGDIVYEGGAGVNPEILAPEIRGHTHAHGHEHAHERAP
jgi:uncharacterized membrane protein